MLRSGGISHRETTSGDPPAGDIQGSLICADWTICRTVPGSLAIPVGQPTRVPHTESREAPATGERNSDQGFIRSAHLNDGFVSLARRDGPVHGVPRGSHKEPPGEDPRATPWNLVRSCGICLSVFRHAIGPHTRAPEPLPRRDRPRLRGVSHQVAAIVAAPAAYWLATTTRDGPARTGALVYGTTLVALLAVSALYHRRYWPSSVRHWIGRIDHSAIFLLIAGTYTPLCLLLGPGTGRTLLAGVWIAAALGIVLVVLWHGMSKRLRSVLYVLLGWVIFPALPALRSAVGDWPLFLLFAGGFFYTVGAVVYALRKPDPFPRVFGFHEIFHLLVVAAAACHFAVVEAAVRALDAVRGTP